MPERINRYNPNIPDANPVDRVEKERGVPPVEKVIKTGERKQDPDTVEISERAKELYEESQNQDNMEEDEQSENTEG
jgi:hypothetical protein